jgi:hypothetical protein
LLRRVQRRFLFERHCCTSASTGMVEQTLVAKIAAIRRR